MKPWSLPLFLLISVLMPVGLLLRFGVLGPSMVIPPLRRVVVARFSGLQINPKYERRSPEGAFARQWFWKNWAPAWSPSRSSPPRPLGVSLRVLLGYMVVIGRCRAQPDPHAGRPSLGKRRRSADRDGTVSRQHQRP
jgi:hypothetical protein